MSFPVVNGNILSCNNFAYGNNQVQQVDTSWIISAVIGAPTSIDFVSGLDSLMASLLLPAMPAAATYYGTKARLMTPANILYPEFANGNTATGTAGGNLLPTQVRGLIKWNTAQLGRAYRGRMYVPFPSTAFNTAAGLPTAGYTTVLNTISSALILGFGFGVAPNTGFASLVIFNKKLRINRGGVVFGPTSSKWATQRRGGSYGRPNVIPPF